jgi:hypothetical protein
MGFLSRWAEKRENKNRRADLRLQREGYVLDLYERENKLMERLQSDTRGLGASLRFGLSLSGAQDDPDTEKELTDANVLIERILDSRVLCRDNPFARSAITNMQHYVVGPDGMRFHLNDPSKKSAAIKVAEVWKRWVETTGFVDHQHECVRRVMRDGVVYRRWFDNAEFRMIEPTSIKGPPGAEQDSERKWGIKTAPDDVQTREAYHIDEGQGTFSSVPAAEVDYLNWKDADANVLRPSPLLFDFLEYLEGAASVLRNMRELVRVQTAIAIIREHPEGRAGHQINAWADSLADKDQTDTDADRDVRQAKWHPGTMLDVQHGGKIHFPAAQMAVDKMTGALQADLRAVAAALGLPEFIFTADAGRNNYASLMAAEGPAVKTFTTFQGWLGRFQLLAFRRVMVQAATGGIIITDPVTGEQERLTVPRKVLRALVTVNGPSVKTRDQFSEARTNAIHAGLGVISPQRITQQNGDDYGEQMRLIEEHNANFGDVIPWPPKKEAAEEEQTGSETRNAGGAEQ